MPTSHHPQVQQIIFICHAYSPHLRRLLNYALRLHMPKLCTGKGCRVKLQFNLRTELGRQLDYA